MKAPLRATARGGDLDLASVTCASPEGVSYRLGTFALNTMGLPSFFTFLPPQSAKYSCTFTVTTVPFQLVKASNYSENCCERRCAPRKYLNRVFYGGRNLADNFDLGHKTNPRCVLTPNVKVTCA